MYLPISLESIVVIILVLWLIGKMPMNSCRLGFGSADCRRYANEAAPPSPRRRRRNARRKDFWLV
jgi:hypothetical protein